MIISYRLTTAERLRLARKRRGMQLKRWAQREREYRELGRKDDEDTTRVNFVPAIMLLEAASTSCSTRPTCCPSLYSASVMASSTQVP